MSRKEKVQKILEHLPPDGFLKVTTDKPAELDSGDKAALIRKGNELFNQGKIDLAKRIFITAGYTDGLIRIGDLYLKQNLPLEALKMYWLAPDTKKVEAMVEKMGAIISKWLREDNE
ncbi:MAG: hypothetical protein J7K04_11510 [Spirochaetales bacterium]|nr:hypothetical protein [Spirochaetales bacterium]